MFEIVGAWRDRRLLARNIREHEEREENRQAACELITRVLGYRADAERRSAMVAAGTADLETHFDSIIDQEILPEWQEKIESVFKNLDREEQEGLLVVRALKTRYLK